jgi:hypothetical protein
MQMVSVGAYFALQYACTSWAQGAPAAAVHSPAACVGLCPTCGASAADVQWAGWLRVVSMLAGRPLGCCSGSWATKQCALVVHAAQPAGLILSQLAPSMIVMLAAKCPSKHPQSNDQSLRPTMSTTIGP